MTEIIKLPINQITPDPNQPRKRLNEDELKDMAQSIKSEGIINPIEIDENKIIITGERRWRAAKIAGLETVPCFVNNLKGKRRFKHQVIENVHHNTMSELDTAKALTKILKDYKMLPPGGTLVQPYDKGISWLSKELGKSRGYIEEKLHLLEMTPQIQRAIENKQLPATVTRPLKKINKDHREKLEQKFLKGELKTREAGNIIVQAIEENPDKAEEVLNTDFKNMSTIQVQRTIDKIAPTEATESEKALKAEFNAGQAVIDNAIGLRNLLAEFPISKVSKTNISSVVIALSQLRRRIDDYLKGQEVIEGKTI